VSQWQPQQYDPRNHRRHTGQPAPRLTRPDENRGQSPRFTPQYPEPQPSYAPTQAVPAPRAAATPLPRRPQALPARRPLPAYPRFPRLAGRSGRGPSIFRIVYLGTHPVALMLSLIISCLMIEVWAAVAAVIVSAWLLQCGVVAIQRAAAGRA
jgi:hypothetical protein